MTTDGGGSIRPIDYYRHLNQQKFTVELELLSSLASPSYLTHLYNLGHLHDPAFIRYVAHLLQTWSTPAYVRFLRFPNALLFGNALVRSAAFRQAVGADGWEHEVTQELIAAWAGQSHSAQSTAFLPNDSTPKTRVENQDDDLAQADANAPAQVLPFIVKQEPLDDHLGKNGG